MTTTTDDLRALDRVVAAPPRHWVGDGFQVAGYFNAIPDRHLPSAARLV